MTTVNVKLTDLITLKGKEAVRTVSDKLAAEYAETLKVSETWPFPALVGMAEITPSTHPTPNAATGKYIILGGGNRSAAAELAKWTGDIPVDVVQPGSAQEALIIGIKDNLKHGARFTESQRDNLIRRVIAGGANQVETAELFGIHKSTVSRVVRGESEESTPEKKARGGKARKGKHGKKKKTARGAAFTPTLFVVACADLTKMAKLHDTKLRAYMAATEQHDRDILAAFATVLTGLAYTPNARPEPVAVGA